MRPRVLALISCPGDRSALERWLAGRYELTDKWPGDGQIVDACLVDEEAFARFEKEIHAMRVQTVPLTIPVVLLVSTRCGSRRNGAAHPDVDARVGTPLTAGALLATLDQVMGLHRRSCQIEGRRQFLQGLLDQTLVGIYLVVADRIVYANAGALQMFGRTLAELSADDALTPFEAGDRPRIHALRAPGRLQDALPEQVRITRPDGHTVTVELQELLIEHEGQAALCGTMIDVQRRLEAEHARLEAARREQATRLELDASQQEVLLHKRLFDAVSHELRTPLMELRGYAEMCEEGPACDRAAYLAAIAASVDRLEHLVENLLQYTRFESDLETFRPEAVDPDELVRRLCERFARHHPDLTVTIGADRLTGPFTVRADGRLLELLLTNLLEETLRRSRAGSTVHIEMTRERDLWCCKLRSPRSPGSPPRGGEIPDRHPMIDDLGTLGVARHINDRILRLHGARVETGTEDGQTCVSLRVPVRQGETEGPSA
jgi:PAS domain S-box-containing protein